MTLGILGGGQLGKMLAMAASSLGLQVRCLDPAPQSPAGQVAELIVGNYNDPESLEKFSRGLDMVTYEFENIPLDTVRSLEKYIPVYSPPVALEIGQDRYREKLFFQNRGIPVPGNREVDSEDRYYTAIDELRYPVVVKSRRYGYDGKGQFILRNENDARKAWDTLRAGHLILEEFIPFERELSLIGVHNRSGSTVFYPLIENIHKNGILRLSRAPFLDNDLQILAESYMRKIFSNLQYVGVLAVEFFHYNGTIVANEMAPRVHNSGHWTIEGTATSQFENYLRAIFDYPLGFPAMRGVAAMVNLIGSIPEIHQILSFPDVHLHLYGKTPRTNRKLGHLTILGEDPLSLDKKLSHLLPYIEYNGD
jgi:5-(carboxyamino)imidazole ribonucleotide synthase